MNQNSFRTPGDTSADAAGLPILPGLVRPDEVLDQGVINHALAVHRAQIAETNTCIPPRTRRASATPAIRAWASAFG